MTLTALDPTPALIVIDLQKGIVAAPLVHPTEEIVAAAANLARAFRRRGWPVALVNVAGVAPGRTDRGAVDFTPPPGWTDLVDELDAQPSDHLITKHRRSAFSGTDLDDRLRRDEVTQVVLTGLSTSAGVESTARAAHDLGYHVVLAIDAKARPDAEPGWEAYLAGGREPTGRDAVAWAAEGAARGAGEILLTSMDRDGTHAGYDLALTRAVAEAVAVPVIASGGAGSIDDLAAALDAGADAVLCASILHDGDHTVAEVKAALARSGAGVRLSEPSPEG